MQEAILSFIDAFGYWAVFLLIAVENIFPPIPSEIILTFGGFASTYTSMHVLGVILAATVGSFVGAIVLYGIGRIFTPERLTRLISGKVGKALGFKPEDVTKAENWFRKRGYGSVFFCRFVPIVRSLISIPAGICQMPFLRFSVYTILGSLIWNSVLVLLGAVLGESWESVLSFFDAYSYVVVAILAVVVIAGCFWFWKKRKKG